MAEIIPFPNSDTNPLIYDEEQSKESVLATEAVLFGAMEQQMKDVIVVGLLEDGSLYLASNTNILPKVNFLLDLAKSRIMNSVD